MQRRDFLKQLGFGSVIAALGSAVGIFARFLIPNVVTPKSGPVEIGSPQEYRIGAVTYVETARAYIGRDQRGFYALAAICTHLGCTPRLEENQLACPCHGSRFDLGGKVLAGPAKRPLDRITVGVAPNGKLFVDGSRIVDAAFRFSV
jgi:cytochrome b6-f complex iron-sulfur subunit